MYKYIQLSRNETTKMLVNLDAVAFITKRMVWNKDRTASVEQGSMISYAGSNDYYDYVLESYEEIVNIVSQVMVNTNKGGKNEQI